MYIESTKNKAIKNGNLVIYLNDDKEDLKNQIQELQNVKRLIYKMPSYHLLDGKTQMIDQKDENTVRSRMEHTNNVANIAKNILREIYSNYKIEGIVDLETFELNQKKEELYVEITALAHDLGHTPFGHSGEMVLNEFVESITDTEEIQKVLENRKKYFGIEYEEEQGHTDGFEEKLSFEHNEQSVVEFFKLVEENNINQDKVNIQRIVKAILAHSISRVPEVPKDLIAQIVRQTDKIEYRNRDYDELKEEVRINSEDIELMEYVKLPTSERINLVVKNIAREAIEKGRIDDDNESMKITKRLRKQYEQAIYFLDETGKRGLISGNNREREQMIYKKLLEYYYQHVETIPTKILAYNDPINQEKSKKRVKAFDSINTTYYSKLDKVISYVNSFTNERCINRYMRLVKERILKGEGYGIEPITPEEIARRKKIQIQDEIDKIRACDIYKSSSSHSDYETLKRLQQKNRKFFEEYLTQTAKKKIEENQLKHSKENRIDIELMHQVRQADKKRNRIQGDESR